MNAKYKVGDICIAVNDPTNTPNLEVSRYTGEECTVVEDIHEGTFFAPDFKSTIQKMVYGVQFRDGRKLWATEKELVRKDDREWAKKQVAKLLDFPLPVEMLA